MFINNVYIWLNVYGNKYISVCISVYVFRPMYVYLSCYIYVIMCVKAYVRMIVDVHMEYIVTYFILKSKIQSKERNDLYILSQYNSNMILNTINNIEIQRRKFLRMSY